MQKKIVIFIIFALVLAVGGVFWWWISQEGENPQGYIIRETSEGKFVESSKQGISMKAPAGWQIELPTNEQTPVSFYSPEVIGQEIPGPIEKGCKMEVWISDEKIDIETLEKQWKKETQEWYTILEDEYYIIDFQGYRALKNISKTLEGGGGYSINIGIPLSEKLYIFTIFTGIDYKEKCSQEFDKFLETVLIQ